MTQAEALVDTPAAALAATCAAAAAAAPAWACSSGAARGALLRALAAALEARRDTLVPLADSETQLGTVRLKGELDRTAFQLRAFATLAEAGVPFAAVNDPAVAGPPPAGRPQITRASVALGPVAMFAASNFPFAFSVLGGDTASALAGGCTVVVKAHPGHPRLSRAVAALAAEVVAAQGLAAGVFGMVEGASVDTGVALVRNPHIAAVAFTGSVRGGVALWKEANARPRPIPFFGELGSINPVVALPSALAAQGPALASALAASITQGCGQFCTSPGVLLLRRDDANAPAFVQQLGAALAAATPHAMLHAGLRAGFDAGVQRLASQAGVQTLVAPPHGEHAPRARLLATDAPTFINTHALQEEVFGPACLVVWVNSLDETLAVLAAVQGSLTATLWGAEADTPDNRCLVQAAQAVAGRVLFAGVPTGVAVTAAQQHGGPWPASTQPHTTSVGHAALQRFLRPVAWQDAPAWVLAR